MTSVHGRDRLNMIGGLGGGTGLRFRASAKVIADGGRLDTYPERILVENATTATIVMTAATSYRGADPEVAVERHIAAAAHKGFERLRADNVADHQRLFRRATLRLGAGRRLYAADRRTTGTRQTRRAGFGARSAVFSIRPILADGQQSPRRTTCESAGDVERQLSPPWDSDYHLNINLQMNYWPAEVSNLAETHLPLFDYIESLRAPGGRRQRSTTAPGASWPITSLISGDSPRPGDLPRSGLWPTGAAWLIQHLWEH